MKKSKGFTLIELMVVIVILGILAAVIAPRIPDFVNKAKEGRTKGNLGGLRSTLNIYYGDQAGMFPVDTLASLVPRFIKTIPEAEVPRFHPASSAVAEDAPGDTPARLTPDDVGGWIYERVMTEANWGDIGVNCNAHFESGGKGWSAF